MENTMQTKHPDYNYVGMGVHVCPVCLKEHDEVVLLDTRLRPTLERRNFMGWKLCDEHEKLWKKGYIALIECTNDKLSTSLEDVKRTNLIAHLHKNAWSSVFNLPVPDQPITFVQEGVIDRLQAMTLGK